MLRNIDTRNDHRSKNEHAHRIGRVEGLSSAITFCVCSVLSLGLYLSSFAVEFGENNAKSRPTPSAAETEEPMAEKLPGFQLAGVQLGMTPVEASWIQPEMRLSGDVDRGQRGAFNLGKGTYKVSFMGSSGARKAYRIHYKETFSNFSEVELRHHLVVKFGKPAVIRCGKDNPLEGWECTYHWWRPDGVILDAITRTVNNAGGTLITTINLVAVDPRIEALNAGAEVPKGRNKPFWNAISAAARGG